MNEDIIDYKYHLSKSFSKYVLRDVEAKKSIKFPSIDKFVEYVKTENIPFEKIQLTRSVSNKEQKEITDKLMEK